MIRVQVDAANDGPVLAIFDVPTIAPVVGQQINIGRDFAGWDARTITHVTWNPMANAVIITVSNPEPA